MKLTKEEAMEIVRANIAGNVNSSTMRETARRIFGCATNELGGQDADVAAWLKLSSGKTYFVGYLTFYAELDGAAGNSVYWRWKNNAGTTQRYPGLYSGILVVNPGVAEIVRISKEDIPVFMDTFVWGNDGGYTTVSFDGWCFDVN